MAYLSPEAQHLSQDCNQGGGWGCSLVSRFNRGRVCPRPHSEVIGGIPFLQSWTALFFCSPLAGGHLSALPWHSPHGVEYHHHGTSCDQSQHESSLASWKSVLCNLLLEATSIPSPVSFIEVGNEVPPGLHPRGEDHTWNWTWGGRNHWWATLEACLP